MNISPEVIEFHAPLAEPSSRTLTISNTTDVAHAFKIKTTAPKLYCVRPSAAFIRAGESVNVAVIHQGFKTEPAADFKCKDKFMILSCPLDEPHLANLDELIKQESGEAVSAFWTHIEATSKDLISSKKIRAVAHPLVSNVNETQAPVDNSSSSSSSVSNSALPSAEKSAAADATGTKAPAAPVSTTNEKELAEAKAKIQALLKEIDNQKKPKPSSGDSIESKSVTSSAVKNKAAPPANGIPLSFAALMILIAFLVGWLFF
ncbi:hypothetical protein NADFUDRAFT_46812 [Nadsonia fulvescens var. elongata DSM 6958]|uniref:MSP domain-containing protein n=1 Tax=Nadsonia fulvescens var. elongata DSM 6958 TaxID=857566 RepID=A0A1E3PHX2_9ASCO|nr:hypothetical protein NADFUDRAFT_46812 [Nadsonia fulvescens var. elongata DSM 6958]